MSEHYDFHYQPTGSGAISGQQVLEQTEDAINELGDYVNDNVGGAMDVAQQALETAQNAEQDAQTALDTANSFSSAIQSAQQDASTALSTAQTAQTTASNANNTAIQAQQDANTAVTTANNASGQVSTLSGTVTTLGQRVTTAEGNIGQNTSDITALTTRVGTAEGNITTLQNDVSIAQGNASSAMTTAGQVKQQAFVFRYSSTALVASSTNANSLLDNTDNLKVGDKVIDSNGVLFSITAIDTANSTFTIGTALVDLATDSDVVHKSGDETVAGYKVFENICLRNSIKAINLENQTIDLNNCYSSFGLPQSGNISFYFCNTNDGTANISNLPEQRAFFLISQSIRILSGGSVVYLKQTLVNSNGKTFVRYCINSVWGSWQNVTNLVTTDTNQTISGAKIFTDNISLKSLTAEYTVTGAGISVTYSDKNGLLLAQNKLGNYQSGISYNKFSIFAYDSNNQLIDRTLTYGSNSNLLATTYFRPDNDNIVSLGTTGNRWSKVYAINYYYGNDNVEFSTKFVTTDTAQTISGTKTFTDFLIYNSDTTAYASYLNLKNQRNVRGSGETGVQGIQFLDKNGKTLTLLESRVISNGNTGFNIICYNTDGNNQSVSDGVSVIKSFTTTTFTPTTDNAVTCGRALAKWSDVVTYKVNGVEPSSLSLPSGNVSDVIDISSYITDMSGNTVNSYTVPANGWISIAVIGTFIAIVSSRWSDSRLRASSGDVRMLYPVLKNETLDISVTGTTLAYARFIPCQGNV